MNNAKTKRPTLCPVSQNGSTDIRHIDVDKNLPPAERIQNYLNAVGDPYHFMVGDTRVSIRFTGEKSLTSCVAGALNAAIN